VSRFRRGPQADRARGPRISGRDGTSRASKKSTPITPTGLFVFAAVFLVTALVLVWFGMRKAADAAVLDQRGVSAPGIVVQVDHNMVSNGPIGGYTKRTDVTVAFTDTRGTRVRATQEGSESTKVGDRFRILYDPVDPSNIRWDTSANVAAEDWVWAAISLGESVLCVTGALWKVARRRHAPRAQAPA